MSVILKEPTLFAGAVRAVILCAVAFGLRLTPEQIGATMLAVEAVLTLLNRAVVTPTSQPTLALGTPVTIAGAPNDVPPPDAVVALKDIGN